MKILSNKDPLDVFLEASSILSKAVCHTLGPDGANTAVHFQNYYNIVNDGKTIVEQLTSLDPEIAPAIETLKQSAFETNRKAGDGTTSTIIIMHKLIEGAIKYLKRRDISRAELSRKLISIESILQELIATDKETVSELDYYNIAKVSLGDNTYANLIAEAFTFLEGEGTPALVKSDIQDVEIEHIDGVNLTKTKVESSKFIDLLPSKELENVNVVTLFQPVNRFEEIMQLVIKLSQDKDRYTIMLYNEMSASVLENLLFNLSQDRSKIIPICMINYKDNMNNMLSEIAKYSGAEVIDGADIKTTDISKIKIGKIDRAIVSQESLILVREDAPTIDYEYISKRACIIRIGGATKIDLEDTYKRIEDAVYSLAGAIKHGALYGGYGVPYADLAMQIDDYHIPDFVIDALCYINTVLFKAETDNEALDSALVISQVIKNSFITAAQAISTQVIVYDNIR